MSERRSRTDLFVAAAERLAGSFLAFVTVLTFLTVVLRYGFSTSIPDSYDLSRNFLGILIFWGIAITGFRGEHITVDVVWGLLPPRGKRVLDIVSTVFTLVCMAVFTWAMTGKVLGTRSSGETTYDLSLPVWPFYAVACFGLAVSAVLLVLRLVKQLGAPVLREDEAAPITISH